MQHEIENEVTAAEEANKQALLEFGIDSWFDHDEAIAKDNTGMKAEYEAQNNINNWIHHES